MNRESYTQCIFNSLEKFRLMQKFFALGHLSSSVRLMITEHQMVKNTSPLLLYLCGIVAKRMDLSLKHMKAFYLAVFSKLSTIQKKKNKKPLSAMRMEIFTLGDSRGCIHSLIKGESLMLISISTFLACES